MAISHIKSNAVPDFTGTVTVFNSAGVTATTNATALVRPSDWNSVHNQYMTLSGNTAGASTLSGTNLVLQGGNNVTLSGTDQTIIVSGPNQTAFVLSNSNGISFGTNGSTVTAQHNGLTTARASNDAIGLNSAFTAGPLAMTINSAGLSLNAGSAAGTSTGFTGGSISASMTHDTAGLAVSLSHPAWLTTAAQSNHSHGNPTLNLTNLSGTTASNSAGFTLSLSAAAPGAVTLTNYATGNTTQSSSGTIAGSSIILRGDGGVSAGVSNGSLVVSGPALTSLSATGALSASSNGSTISLGVGTVTASIIGNTTQTSSGSINLNALVVSGAGGISAGISAGTLILSGATGGTGGGGGVGLGVSTMGNTAGTTGTVTTGNVALVGSGVISLSQSSSGSNATISILAPATSSLSATGAVSLSTNGSTISIGVGQVTITATGNTTQTSTGGISLHSLHLSGAGNVSVGVSAGSVIISGGTAAAAPVNFSAGTTSNNLGSVVFGDSNGVSFGLNGSTITASYTRPVVSDAIQAVGSATGSGTNTSRFAADDHIHEGVFSVGVSTGGNTAGDTRVGPGRFVLQGGNNITLSQITGANAVNTIVVSGGAAGAADGINALVVNGGASTASTTLTLSNSNNVTFGHNAGVITASASFAQTNQSAIRAFGVSNTGQTAGNTGVSTGIDWVLAGSGSITMSQSTAGGGPNTVWVQHPAWITTARASNDAVGLNTALTAGPLAWTVNSSGISLNASSAAGTTSGFAGNLISGSMTHNTAGLNLSLNHPAWLTTAMQSNAATISNVNISAGTTSTNASAFTFANSNGITFGLSSGAGAGQITASHNGLTTARASTDAIGLNTAQTNVTWTVNSSGLSLNAAGYAGTGTTFAGANISASMTLNSVGLNLSASVAAPGAAAESNAINLLGANTAGNTTATGSTIGFSGVNMTLSGTNASQVVFSVPATSSLSATGNASLSTNGSTISLGANAAAISIGGNSTSAGGGYSNVSSGTLVLAGGNNITLSQNGATVTISGGAGGGGAAISAGTQSVSTGTVIFSNSNGISFSMAGSQTVTASYNPLAGGISNVGNTAGNTGTGSTGTLYFAGSNSLTLSQATAAGATTIHFQPLMWALSGGAGISLSTTGSTIVILTV